MLFPGCDCSQKLQQPSHCNCSGGAKLPHTISVTFSGLHNKTHTAHAELTFASDFGSGAGGILLGPGGCDDHEYQLCGASNRGPITGVLLTSGGGGYAVLGRVALDVIASATPGQGCTFTSSLTSGTDSNGCPTWSLGSIGVSGGSGYVDGTEMDVTFDYCNCSRPVVLEGKPTAKLRTQRFEPALTASVEGGTGAALSVTVSSNGGNPQTWGAASVAVNSGGTGYPFYRPVNNGIHGATLPVSFATDGITVTEATAVARPVVVEPETLLYYTPGYVVGTGFEGTLILSPVTSGGLTYYLATDIAITNGGAGYSEGDLFEFQALNRDADPSPASGVALVYVASVDESGAVTACYVDGDFQEPFGMATGAIRDIVVDSAGAYFGDTGIPSSVEVTHASKFYCEDLEQPPCVASVTVTAGGGPTSLYNPNYGKPGQPYWLREGKNAVIAAQVDTSPLSPTFGQIASLDLVDPGEGYLAWHWQCTGEYSYNGSPPFVLTAGNPESLITVYTKACFGCTATGRVTDSYWDGVPGPIHQVVVTNAGSGYAVLGREEPTGMTIGVADGAPGTGASFNAVWTQTSDDCGRPLWSIDSISTSGGTGYTEGEPLYFPAVPTPALLHCVRPAAATIALAPDSTTPQSVTVTDGGLYYRENPALPAIVADITVVIVQADGSSGSGAVIHAVVNTTVGSPQFGKVTAFTVVEGGSGYSPFGAPTTCSYTGGCDVGGEHFLPQISMSAREGEHLILTLNNRAVFRSEHPIGSCASLPSAPLWCVDGEGCYGAPSGMATISAGGVWDEHGRDGCDTDGCTCYANSPYLTSSTCVKITSDIPCDGGGTLGYTGAWGDRVFNCSWTCNGFTYEDDVHVYVMCCPLQCPDGECVLQMRAYATGTVHNRNCVAPDGFCLVGSVAGWDGGRPEGLNGNGYCASLTLEGGEPKGTLTIPVGNFTITIEFGACPP